MLLLHEKSPVHYKAILLATIASLAFHFFFMVDGFGETDSVRLALFARMWHDANIFSNSYTYRVSPLYLLLLKTALQAGFPVNSLGDLMNWSSLIIAGLTLIPMFCLFRKLLGIEVAFMGCLLYSFTPAFWIAHIYGMPMIHAFFCFLISLLLFFNGLDQKKFSRYVFMFLSVIFGAVAVHFKADIILCFGTFLGIALYSKQHTLRNIIWSFLIPVIAIISVFVLGRMLFPSLDADLACPKIWNHSFPFTLEAITNEPNFSVIPKSVGKWMFLAISISVLICLFKKEYRRQLLLVIFGSAPTFLFWGLKLGNSARHMMAAYLFLVFLLAFVIFALTNKYKYWPVLVICLIAVNYFSCEAGGNPGRPGSRIFSTTAHLEKTSKQYEQAGEEFYKLPYPKKIYVGKAWETPHLAWRWLSMASKVEYIEVQKGFHIRLIDEKGNSQEIKIKHINTEHDRSSFGPVPGWYLWTFNKSIHVRN